MDSSEFSNDFRNLVYIHPRDSFQENKLSRPMEVETACQTKSPKVQVDSLKRCYTENEQRYYNCCDYIELVQQDGMKPIWRRKLFSWMFEFVDEYGIALSSVAVAMNYIDRYLEHISTKKSVLQLVALSAILVATKLYETVPLSIKDLRVLAEGVYPESDIRLMELELIQVLNWELNPLTIFDTLDFYLAYFDTKNEISSSDHLKGLTEAFLEILLCEYEFLRFRPSESVTASLLCVMKLCMPKCCKDFERILVSQFSSPERMRNAVSLVKTHIKPIFPQFFLEVKRESVVSPANVNMTLTMSVESLDEIKVRTEK